MSRPLKERYWFTGNYMNELLRDSELTFPHYMILKASAGAGKTSALTKRYVQFLLSERIPDNKLKNILAITYSRNAAKHMKARILEWLKKLYFKDERTVSEFSELLLVKKEDQNPEALSTRALLIIEEILDNYSDFQVKTIDSFMSSLFRASATDFGLNPDFEILMNNKELMTYAFELFIKDIREGSEKAERFREIINLLEELSENSYCWDPAKEILKNWIILHEELSASNRELKVNEKIVEELKKIESELQKVSASLIELFNKNTDNLHDKFNLDNFIKHTRERSFLSIKWKGKPPTTKKTPPEDSERIKILWNRFQDLLKEYSLYYAMAYFLPYIMEFENFSRELEDVKSKEGKLFIEDIGRYLASYLSSSKIPDIYFRLGERISHYLIDEFQDTSYIQWCNLYPLIENALSMDGSLFVVGDTKQAIYGFRRADYRIMKHLETGQVFPSAQKIVSELDRNYRSGGVILRFNEKVFKEILPESKTLCMAATLSDFKTYTQKPVEDKKDKGYVEVTEIERERAGSYICSLIMDLKERGYSYSDIVILALKNEHVVEISGWLNEGQIDFISHSSLDVRQRKVTAEVLNLLKFLDSPVDDFAFSVFIQGDLYKRFISSFKSIPEEIFKKTITSFLLKHRNSRILYKSFEKEFPILWKENFEELFRLAGYLPLYDLLSMCMSKFRLFDVYPDGEAAFIKILEVARIFENRGFGNIRDFVEFFTQSFQDSEFWNMVLPSGKNAVNVMTVHQSKGLEFPVCILYLSWKNSEGRRKTMRILEDEEGLHLIKLKKDFARHEKLHRAYEERRADELASKVNTLYVALTRAEDELYVIIDKNEIPEIIKNEIGKIYGSKLTPEEIGIKKERDRRKKEEVVPFGHYLFTGEFPVLEREIHLQEKERGEFIHRILSSIEYYYEGIEGEIMNTIEKHNELYASGLSPEELKKIYNAVLNTIKTLEPYFRKIPARVVKNEKEFADGSGSLHRMDRVVIDQGLITVIDYKTGHPSQKEMEEHIIQVKDYKRILKELYPSINVKGILFYVDKGEAREI
ncbi:MAG: UvrD-helicase domain-containing protein [Thermodesulfovibrionales bacterium]|nr:UvrD-helicase domain-containing protein [Thermodesulfovibrionales bacterium]